MRVPRIAGSWYPNSAEEILRIVEGDRPVGSTPDRPVALIVPHVGYAYSEGVAARAFARLPTNAYDCVIVLAPSHHVAMRRTFSVEPPEQGWDVQTMLTHLSLKAGLGPDDWKSGASFETFRAQVFN